MRTTTPTRGYTLVELLVVISIIGILMSLSIPAVLNVKKRMNRTECEQNLRQIAMATINYEISGDSLPGYCQKFGEFRGGIDPGDPGNYAGSVPRHFKIGGWQVAILAKLEHVPFYELWDDGPLSIAFGWWRRTEQDFGRV